MSGAAWQVFDRELQHRIRELARELLGKPDSLTTEEWRWGRKGSLSLVVSGARASLWFDHEAGDGGGFPDLVARHLKTSRHDAIDWIASRIGMAPPPVMDPVRSTGRQPIPRPSSPAQAPNYETRAPTSTIDTADRAAAIWRWARPAPFDHPYLVTKQVTPLGLRMDSQRRLVVPLQNVEGCIHTLEYISSEGNKRFLAGGAKRGHFSVVGTDPTPVNELSGPLLICEGWATGASLYLATGYPVIAAMDAGNLLPVSETLRARLPEADLVIVADNDAKDGRSSNPGIEAARKTAAAVDARLAILDSPGDANDLACARGMEAVAKLVAGAAKLPQPGPTYPAPALSPEEARGTLAQDVARFMQQVAAYWEAVDYPPLSPPAYPPDNPPNLPWLDFNDVQAENHPPLLGLPVDVGLGKSSAAREAIAGLLASGALAGRKVIFAVPRHDLGGEQVSAFRALGIRTMLWKGRTAANPVQENPEQLMCLDPAATFDALEIEHPVEQSCCSLRQNGVSHLCSHYAKCGYQRQKPDAQDADVIVCAHDSLFHMKAEAIGKLGLLVIDEGFWQAGLRGLDGKATLTLDGLEPGRSALACYTHKNKLNVQGTADLVAARMKLWKALHVSEPGILRHGLLAATGLTVEECRKAAGLERRRLRNAGLLPGMTSAERLSRIMKIMPPEGTPWAPPGRCATLWLILASALEEGHDVAGVELFHERTEAGSVKSLRLRWRSRLRGSWAAGVPILHLDATLRQELVEPYLRYMDIQPPVTARQPHVRARLITGSPTSAKALTPLEDAPERDHRAAAGHLRDIAAWVALRALQHRQRHAAPSVLVIGQKATIGALRRMGLPSNVDAVHFNGLSGLDRWGDVHCLIVLGRTLPTPLSVERTAMALTGRMPVTNPAEAGWWYPLAEKHLRLTGRRTMPLMTEAHADPIAEAIRWSICEGELIQAIGRGRGVNRTPETPLEIDLLTDAVLPITVHEVIPWSDLKPQRRDLMALQGVVLENAADMATCFPTLWPSADSARQDRQRSVTNCYYKDLYNSRMSHSSAEVTYRPEGAGQRLRTAQFDLSIIPDPRDWFNQRLGPLSQCHIVVRDGQDATDEPRGEGFTHAPAHYEAAPAALA